LEEAGKSAVGVSQRREIVVVVVEVKELTAAAAAGES
jgi:hypothetical protein